MISCLQRGARQGAVEVGDVDDAQHDGAAVALQPDLVAHLRREQSGCGGETVASRSLRTGCQNDINIF